DRERRMANCKERLHFARTAGGVRRNTILREYSAASPVPVRSPHERRFNAKRAGRPGHRRALPFRPDTLWASTSSAKVLRRIRTRLRDMAASKITWVGFFWRWIAALILVLGTFNPTDMSFVSWLTHTDAALS